MEIVNKLNKFTANTKQLFSNHMERTKSDYRVETFNGWSDSFWKKEGLIRKCHLKTIDLVEERNLWLLHINIFPEFGLDLPILGCDVVAGPNKISGSFFDFSPIIKQHHPMIKHFAEQTSEVTWRRERKLPPWAKKIFSNHMVAAGAVRNEEVDQFTSLTFELMQYYLNNMEALAENTKMDTKSIQNNYCANQKRNPKLHSSILAMGIPEHKKNYYVERILFEEVG